MVFGSNFKKKKSLVYLILAFFLAGAFVTNLQMYKTNIPYLINQSLYFETTRFEPSFYNLNDPEQNFLLNPSIESDQIKSSIAKLFIPIFSHEKKQRIGICDSLQLEGIESLREKAKERRSQLLDCYQQYNEVYLDDQQQSLNFQRTNHPITNQFGIITYIDLESLAKGLHKIRIKKALSNEKNTEWTIPFYYIPD